MRKKMFTGVVAALVLGLSACNCRAQDCVDDCVNSHPIHANYAFSQSIMNSFVPDCGEWMVLNPACRALVRAKYLAILQDVYYVYVERLRECCAMFCANDPNAQACMNAFTADYNTAISEVESSFLDEMRLCCQYIN